MILLVTSTKDGRLTKSALELVSAARELGGDDTPIKGLVLGSESEAAATELAGFLPAVAYVPAEEFSAATAEQLTAAVAQVAKAEGAGVVLAAASRSAIFAPIRPRPIIPICIKDPLAFPVVSTPLQNRCFQLPVQLSKFWRVYAIDPPRGIRHQKNGLDINFPYSSKNFT